jgi:GTP-binding protein LepA
MPIILQIPPPPAPTGGPLRALIYDSYYDEYKGVVVFCRIMDGTLCKGDKVRTTNSTLTLLLVS